MGCGAAFILKTGLPCPGGRRGCMIESLPRRGRWPRPRPRPDEARLYRYYPCTGCGCKVCPHQSAAADSSPLRTETPLRDIPVFRMAYSAIPHHRPYGRWCFARLIRQVETLELQLHSQPPSKHTALSPLKRSCSRFAPLTLRCRTESAFQAVPVFRMAYLPYLTVFRMQAKQIQRLPLRGAGAKRLKGGPWG